MTIQRLLPVGALALALLGLGGFYLGQPKPVAAGETPVAEKRNARQHGLSWVGSGPVERRHLEAAAAIGADWIVQTPFGWQRRHNEPELVLATSGHLWGETDVGLEETNRLACDVGLKVLLKPHIWLGRDDEGKWLGDIAMTSEADWKLWWENYRRFMLHYAALAEREKMAGLCIGTELMGTVATRESDWRSLIADVRAIYHGKLTYAANWYKEYELVPFWDALDWIGVQAYFPLSDQPDPSVAQLVQGWQPHLASLEALSKRTGKPILFTELGYCAKGNAAHEPWLWPNRHSKASEAGLALQSRLYEAFFQAVWPKPWLEGVYIWKWHPHLIDHQGPPDESFTPQGKPAETVLRTQWTAAK